MEIIYDKNIPLKGFKAMTIWPFIFVRSDMRGYFTKKDERHETTHALQQVECLLLPFLLLYCLEWILKLPFCKFSWKRSYMSISFEQEAYEHQDEFGYNNVRKHYSWFKYLFTIKTE